MLSDLFRVLEFQLFSVPIPRFVLGLSPVKRNGTNFRKGLVRSFAQEPAKPRTIGGPSLPRTLGVAISVSTPSTASDFLTADVAERADKAGAEPNTSGFTFYPYWLLGGREQSTSVSSVTSCSMVWLCHCEIRLPGRSRRDGTMGARPDGVRPWVRS